MRAKHLHYLAIDEVLSEHAAPLCVLALHSAGRVLAESPAVREARDRLAGLLGDGPLAELLISPAPVAVDSYGSVWVIEEF